MLSRPLTTIICLALLLLPGCSERQVNKGFQLLDGEAVYLDWNTGEGRIVRKLPNADPATFAALKQPRDAAALFAVDKNNVFVAQFYTTHCLSDADAKTFTLLRDDGSFAKDAGHVYYMGASLPNADPNSFVVLKDPFGKDKKRAFLGTVPIPVEDIDSFEVLQEGHVDDPWHREDRKPWKAQQLSPIGTAGWSRDAKATYYGANKVDGVDLATFELLSEWYARDNKQVFYADKPIQGADPASFVVHDGPFFEGTKVRMGTGPDAHDKNREYEDGRVLTKPAK